MYEDYEDQPLTWQDFYHVQDHLEGLIEDLYETGSIENLEFHLEEVLRMFKLQIPKSDPVVTKKKQRETIPLKNWIGLSKNYVDIVAKKEIVNE